MSFKTWWGQSLMNPARHNDEIVQPSYPKPSNDGLLGVLIFAPLIAPVMSLLQVFVVGSSTAQSWGFRSGSEMLLGVGLAILAMANWRLLPVMLLYALWRIVPIWGDVETIVPLVMIFAGPLLLGFIRIGKAIGV